MFAHLCLCSHFCIDENNTIARMETIIFHNQNSKIMRSLVIVLFLGITAFFMPQNSFAQQDKPVSIDLDIDLPIPKDIQLPGQNQPIPLDDPIILQHNGKCYAFGCQEGPGCEHCTLYWKDRNKDGKINPKKELRCRCDNDPEKKCKLRVKKVECSN